MGQRVRTDLPMRDVKGTSALTDVVGGTLDTTFGAEELAELENVITRQGEIEAALVAVGILPA